MKVVFLDVDGVLHPLAAYEGLDDPRRFTPECMQRLKTIVCSSGAQIVLCSDWRTSPETCAIVDQQLQKHGMAPHHDKTPAFFCPMGGVRGMEIEVGARCRDVEVLMWFVSLGTSQGQGLARFTPAVDSWLYLGCCGAIFLPQVGAFCWQSDLGTGGCNNSQKV